MTLKTKEIALDVGGSQLWIDFAKVLKNRDDVYVNATSVAKQFEEHHNFKGGKIPPLKSERRVFRFFFGGERI